VLAASYPFLDVFWSMVIFFIWVLWFMLLFRIWGDVFHRSDLSGLGKTGWLLFTILVPFLGVFIYVITQNDGMNKRALERARGQQAQMDDYVRATAATGNPAADIEKAKQLLDSGAITQAEFDSLKAKALA
jgi:hypothetical protein